MNEAEIFGIIISVLLSVVAYFIKQIHSDFKQVEKDLAEVKTTTTLIKAEFKAINDLMNQKIDFLEKRLTLVENLIFKTANYDNKKHVIKG